MIHKEESEPDSRKAKFLTRVWMLKGATGAFTHANAEVSFFGRQFLFLLFASGRKRDYEKTCKF